MVEDWTPEPLAVPVTEVEAAENEKRPVIVGCEYLLSKPAEKTVNCSCTVLPDPNPSYRMVVLSQTLLLSTTTTSSIPT